MESFLSLFAEAVQPPSYPLKARYDHFNALLFDNKLPQDIPITWAPLKRASGLTSYKVGQVSNTAQDATARFLGNKYAGYQIKPETLKIQISHILKRTDQDFDGILIHEMLHVFFGVTGNHGEKHGNKFQQMVREFTAKLGFKIPLTDTIDHNMELSSQQFIKTIGVLIMVLKDGKIVYSLYDQRVVKDNIPFFQERLNQTLESVEKNELWLVKSERWMVKSYTIPLQRVLTKPPKVFYLQDLTMLDDLRKQGTLVAAGKTSENYIDKSVPI